ncbi:MAG TPA: tail fiber domain-containing protein, partial [Patescibacteria group bacterium]|nr:tail fiber domain-containing protein [Patescibacteria group bacterium]
AYNSATGKWVNQTNTSASAGVLQASFASIAQNASIQVQGATAFQVSEKSTGNTTYNINYNFESQYIQQDAVNGTDFTSTTGTSTLFPGQAYLHPTTYVAPAYDNPLGMGDRQTTALTVTWAGSKWLTGSSNGDDAIDGEQTSSGGFPVYMSGNDAPAGSGGSYMTFDFGPGAHKVITAAQVFFTCRGSTNQNPGNWYWQGSNDGTSFTNVSAAETAATSYNGTVYWSEYTGLASNTTGYRYYRWIPSNGLWFDATCNAGVTEVQFKIDNAVYTTGPYYITTSDQTQIDLTSANSINSATVTESTNANQVIKYLVSFDGRATWKYWNGSSWQTSTLANAQTNGRTGAQLQTDLANWTSAQGTKLDIAASFFTSQTSNSPTLDNIAVSVNGNTFTALREGVDYSLTRGVSTGSTGLTVTRLKTGTADMVIDYSGTALGQAFTNGGNSFGALNVIGSNDNNALAFRTNSIERGRFDTNGNFGVGTVTPGALFSVGGNALFNGTITVNGCVGCTTGYAMADGTAALPGLAFANDTDTGFFRPATNTIALSTTGTEAARFSSTGNLGLGTTNPAAKLHVEGNINAMVATQIRNTGVYANGKAGVIFGNDTLAALAQIFVNSSGDSSYGGANSFNVFTNTNVPIAFHPQGTERVRITPAGNFGIGTTSPVQLLSVNGSGYFNGNVGIGVVATDNVLQVVGDTKITNGEIFLNDRLNAPSGIKFTQNAGNNVTGHFYMYYGGPNPVLIASNNGATDNVGVQLTLGATSWSATSDRRLKENIKDTEAGLSELLGLKVREFNFIGQDKTQNGFIAQEVYEQYKLAAVKGSDETKYDEQGNLEGAWSVDYNQITALLVKSVQEQQKQIVSLQDALAKLGPKLEGLEVLLGSDETLGQRLVSMEKRITSLEEKFASLEKAISQVGANGQITMVNNTVNNLLASGTVQLLGDVEISGHVLVSNDTAGRTLLVAGTTSVHIAFKKAYASAPQVFLQAKSRVSVLPENITTEGFDITLAAAEGLDITVDWFAVGTTSQTPASTSDPVANPDYQVGPASQAPSTLPTSNAEPESVSTDVETTQVPHEPVAVENVPEQVTPEVVE